MQLPLLVRLCSSVCLLLGLGLVGEAAQPLQPKPADNKAPLPADFERLAEIFAPPGTPSVEGKAWVAVDTRPANYPFDLYGWLIHDRPKEIILLDWYGELHKHSKPGADEKRPKIIQEKNGGFRLDKIQQADHSVAWRVRPEDFAAKTRKFLADGLPEDKETKGVFGMVHQRFGLADYVIEAARFAHVAHQLGHKAQAVKLYAQASNAYKKYADSYSGGFEKAGPLHVFVADRIASGFRNGAIYAGHGGTSRAELQKLWEKIAALQHHEFREEAKEMVKHYQGLLDEDRRWVEPDAKALAKMTTEQKVAYWLYRLRDLDVGQWSDPDSYYVLDKFDFEMLRRDKDKHNPAVG